MDTLDFGDQPIGFELAGIRGTNFDPTHWERYRAEPIYLEQLRCTDRSWTDLAPGHYFVPFGAPKKHQQCEWCGETPGQ